LDITVYDKREQYGEIKEEMKPRKLCQAQLQDSAR
jgi:hypothetical protein